MNESKPYRVLLYYKYVSIENPEEYAAWHLAFCKEHELKGRVLIAAEGINGNDFRYYRAHESIYRNDEKRSSLFRYRL